jgi:hypothetical protein
VKKPFRLELSKPRKEVQIDRKVTKPIVESVPATELHYRCPDGSRLARGGHGFAGNVVIYGGGGMPSDREPTYDVHIKGVGYDYTDDSNGHSRDDSLACIEQINGSGND